VDTVLGLAVTATNVQTVLVEGRGADGATLEHDEFDVFVDGVSAARASEQVAEAVLNIAEADGHRLHSIGVTWSEDADLEASLVLDSLAGMGFANVVAVRSPHAAEALARSIGRVIGYQRTAVCVMEPDTVILSLVGTFDSDVETSVSHAIDSDEQLALWIGSIFEREDWRPEGLFVVGSVGGLDSVAVWLEEQLGLPVFDPPEAQLALAHGAALASASGPVPLDTGVTASPRRLPVGPITMLVAGAVTFVVSVSLAVSPHLAPERGSVPTVQRQVENAAVTPAAPRVVAPQVVPRQVPPPVAPPSPEAVVPVPEAPLPDVVEELPPAVPEATLDEPPVYDPGPSIEAIVPPAPAAPVQPINPIAPPPPAVVGPPAVPEKPRLRDRIIDKIPGLNRLGN
jgi:hypothetical protein